ncbi:hypothetical protein KP806_18810 [Paenibacillus sp. N4]|uniref:hypothetical protein n=1 Tax=Paenibacillus vietnamensis TaxID=2590547 RepID=UPI001CD126F8|nr:hypothetical protein [Paenibacillus vietnamensis]MCA0757118.1 hypothetical protein [Paenibacillus vietnamensis]
MNEFEKDADRAERKGKRDHPEQYPTEKESLFDMYKSQQTVDPIPVEDLKLQVEDEKNKEETKHRSSSENKYKGGQE